MGVCVCVWGGGGYNAVFFLFFFSSSFIYAASGIKEMPMSHVFFA